jgi:hypothetical protein
MAIGPVVGGSDMTHTFRSRCQIKAFPETRSFFVVRIVDRDRLATIFLDDGEARNIGWPVAHVDHIQKRNRADIVRHVVVHVLSQVQQAFVDPKKILRLLSMADDPFRKGDAPIGIFGVLAAKDRA